MLGFLRKSLQSLDSLHLFFPLSKHLCLPLSFALLYAALGCVTHIELRRQTGLPLRDNFLFDNDGLGQLKLAGLGRRCVYELLGSEAESGQLACLHSLLIKVVVFALNLISVLL